MAAPSDRHWERNGGEPMGFKVISDGVDAASKYKSLLVIILVSQVK